MEFLIISGMSGAGKSHAANILEDAGFYCVDNMPVELIPSFAEMILSTKERYDKVVLVTDVRIGQSFDELFRSLDLLRGMDFKIKILFIEARPGTIIRRYKESRRRHPVAADGESIERAIAREHELVANIRAEADYVIDTSVLSTSALREQLLRLFASDSVHPMMVTIFSFGFKYGIPQEADLVFDVRFLPNPFHVPELRNMSGLDEPVRNYVFDSPQTTEFIGKLYDMMDFLLPQYIHEGKAGLVIAVGCTGGRHRSVAIARELFDRLKDKGFHAMLSHRDVSRSEAN